MSLHGATSSRNLGKRLRTPSERVLLAAETAPSKRRRVNPTPKPLVTRFEQEIRTLYSKNRMSPKHIAQLIRNRHGLAESHLTTNMVKGKLWYDIKKGYVTKNPVSIGGTSILARPGPTCAADWRTQLETFASERDHHLKRLIIDADDESEERPESKVMRVFKQAALLWTYEDPQGVYMLAHLRMPAGTHISHAQYCSQWLEVQITAGPPTDASISMMHDKDPAAVQYSSKVIPLKICAPKGMEFDEGVIPIKKWVDFTGAPFVPSGSKQDRCVPRMACFKLMFKRAPPSLESWGQEMYLHACK